MQAMNQITSLITCHITKYLDFNGRRSGSLSVQSGSEYHLPIAWSPFKNMTLDHGYIIFR